MKNVLDIWRPERMNPLREFSSLQRQMDRIFDDISRYTPSFEFQKNIDLVPACDFEETDNAYLISLDVPGMTKDQLQIELSGNTLTVSGDQKVEKNEGKGAWRTYERFHGRFERVFTLPHVSDTEKVEADYKEGVLHIAIPKSKAVKAKSRKIQIGEGKSSLFGKLTGRTEENNLQKSVEKAA